MDIGTALDKQIINDSSTFYDAKIFKVFVFV